MTSKVECNIRDTIANIPQSRNWLKDWEGENDKISGQVWETVEDKVNNARMAEAEVEGIEERNTKPKKERV